VAKPEPTRAKLKQQRNPLHKVNIIQPLNNTVADTRAMEPRYKFGRSFRVGWTHDGKLVVPSFVIKPQERMSRLSIVKVDCPVGDHRLLETAMDNSETIFYERILTPTIVLEDKKVKNAVDAYVEASSDPYQHSVWTLVRALFFSSSPKKDLMDWVSAQVQPLLSKEEVILSRLERRVFYALATHNIEEAQYLAAQNKDYRLATIITQVGNPQATHDLKNQIREWESQDAFQNINEDRLRVYK
jgi:hypothetical protein